VVKRRRRLFLALAVILDFELGLAVLVMRQVEDVERRFRESAKADLADTAAFAALLLGLQSQGGLPNAGRMDLVMAELQRRQVRTRIRQAIHQDRELRVYLLDGRGQVIYDSTGRVQGRNLSVEPDVQLALTGEFGARLSAEPAPEGLIPVLYVAAPIFAQGREVGVVSVGKPTDSVQPYIEAARHNLIIIGLSAGLAVILLAAGVVIWLARPLDLIVDYCRMIRLRRCPERPSLRRTPLGLLGAAIDEMLEALDGRRYVENYVATLTHEIKTPLSTIRAGAELLETPMPAARRAWFLANLREQSDRIQDLIERLLELTALEKRHELTRSQPLELAALVREAADSLALDAALRQVRLEIRVPPARVVEGDRFLLLHALTNLIRNAVEFSPEGGGVDITLSESRRHYGLTVRDRGPGIPGYAEKRVFERFFSLPRPGNGKKGTGLGLSFVQEIADLHHGRVELGNHPEGGAVARLQLRKA
jgi:two-component system sensor histidine kinase CreC